MPDLIKITQEMIKESRQYQESIESTKTIRRKSNFTTLDERDRYFNGFLGELSFKSFLDQNNIKYSHSVNTDGSAVRGKFLLPVKEKNFNLIVNVLTAAKPFHRFMATVESRIGKTNADIYVGMRLNLECDFCELHGFETRKNLYESGTHDFGTGVPGYSIELTHLRPIKELIERIENVEKSVLPIADA